MLCESAEGYQNLSTLDHSHEAARAERRRCARARRARGDDRGSIALAGRPRSTRRRFGVGGLLDRLVGIFGRDRTYVELQRHYRRDEEDDNETLVAWPRPFACQWWRQAASGLPRRPNGRCSTCSRASTSTPMLAHAGRLLAPNAERYLKPPARHGGAVRRSSRRDRSDARAGRSAAVHDGRSRLPVSATIPCRPAKPQVSFLRKITDVGARDRYRPYHDRARAQIARELDLIEKLELAGYFLIVWDIVNFCRQHDILVQGRGSAANSAVCYSLGITAVDPVGMDLLFERFLSEERGEWPDIDLDLPSGDRRERVIQHVYEKYGQAWRGDDGERHHLSRAERGARGGEGARASIRRRSIGWRR